ncbi:MAG: prepilin-type N-terminal cleavage/methylation domain-containing protein [Candidatus Omnitrophica bacterium]|nr:prepilin-type N-terminal cleavage/methylation domain-containing protein [Candidatus Omnitrophota bacterium]MCM8793903.1 prepilin-type N-terminal cleavage/methylation domain-containing protein [Candidatus Omnitrophota bacterium]
MSGNWKIGKTIYSFSIRERRGFTFVEVLVSTIILALVLAEMLASFAGGRLLSRRSRDRLIAQSFAREKLEELLSPGYTALISTPETEDVSFRINYANLEFVRRADARRYYRIEPIFYKGKECYKKVTVVMKWRFLTDVVHTESLSTLIYNPNYVP